MHASTLRIAWRNLGRNRKRTVLVTGAIAVGQLAFLSTAALMRGSGEQYLDSVTGPFVGHAQVHAPGWRDDRSVDLTLVHLDATLAEVRRDPEVAHASPRIYAPVLAALSEEGFMAMVVGVDPVAESHRGGLFPEDGVGTEIGGHRVLVGRILAQRHELRRGMEIAVVGQDVDGSIANDLYTVSGVIDTPVEVITNLGIVMSLGDAQDLLALHDGAHEIVIHVANREMLEETLARLSTLASLEGAELLPWRELVPFAANLVRVMRGFNLVILFIVFIAAAAGIANTMLMSSFERVREFGMLLSLGCGPGRLSRIIVTEAVILGLLGVLIGTCLGVGLVAMTWESGVDYAALGGKDASYEVAFQGLQMSTVVYPRLAARDVAAGIVAVLITSLVSVVWPMVHIARLEPMGAMRS
jgi:ABC-type lipoprotein release transport system permease subunit